MTTTVLNTRISEVENKIPTTSSFVTTIVRNTKTGEVENKISGHTKYIASQKFNKLIAENVKQRLKQADLMSKIDFDKLISFNKIFTEVQQKLNILAAKDCDCMFLSCHVRSSE